MPRKTLSVGGFSTLDAFSTVRSVAGDATPREARAPPRSRKVRGTFRESTRVDEVLDFAVIVLVVLLTAFYVQRSNSRFDELARGLNRRFGQ